MQKIKPVWEWLKDRRHRQWVGLGLAALALGIGGLRLWQSYQETNDPRNKRFFEWWGADSQTRRSMITVQRDACEGAPFVLPADGFIGLLYGDPRLPYSDFHRHQGIDIFSMADPGMTPVVAAYDGYITREEGWVSALIERVPDDPLHPGRQIWLYYTHMAQADGSADLIEEAFPPGTHGAFVKQGTLLGYTGNYSGNSANPVAVHLHFSIVLDNGQGGYRNELDFDNTVDPSRYLGMAVNYGCAFKTPACMRSDPVCAGAVLGLGGG